MGHRLSKIVTCTGDSGSTGLANGERLPKHHLRVEAMGDVDELNCHLGLLLSQGLPPSIRSLLTGVQQTLFNLGGELALPGTTLIADSDVEQLETAIAALNAELPPLKEFILPGGNPASAQAHVARAVARRVERRLWALHEQSPLNAAALRYANRLSDYLFVAARRLMRLGGEAETLWQRT